MYDTLYINLCAHMHIRQRLRQLVQTCIPGSDLELFGSLATGLSLPQSDIDLVALYDTPELRNGSTATSTSANTTFAEGITRLRRIASRLRECAWVSDVRSIETASVPVIKFHVDLRHDSWGTRSGSPVQGLQGMHGEHDGCIDVDISFFHSPGQNTEYVKEQLARFKQLRPLVLVLKRYTPCYMVLWYECDAAAQTWLIFTILWQKECYPKSQQKFSFFF
jgi:DNA polymerase sigma